MDEAEQGRGDRRGRELVSFLLLSHLRTAATHRSERRRPRKKDSSDAASASLSAQLGFDSVRSLTDGDKRQKATGGERG